MAQAIGSKRFPHHRMVGTTVAAVMLAATLTGVAVLRETDHLPFLDADKAQVVAPVTIGNEAVAFDEGIAPAVRPATGNRPTDQRAALREGLITGTGAATDTIQAYPSAGQGEGIIGGHNSYQVPAGVDDATMHFLELNLILPESGAADVSGTDMRFWDENVYLPTGADTTQQSGEGFTAE